MSHSAGTVGDPFCWSVVGIRSSRDHVWEPAAKCIETHEASRCDPQAADNPAVADTLASTLDISATVLDRARIEPFSGIQGRSLLPALRGAGAVRESVFIQYDHQHPSPGTNVPPRVHSLIDRRYRISVFHGTGWGELYDLQADPGEFENLWEDPAHASIRARMVEQLLMAEIEHVDRVPLPTRRA